MVETVEIPYSRWPGYFDAVSRAMKNAQLSIEVARDRSVPEIQVNSLALQFLAYDARDELFEVAGEPESSRPIGVYHHLVERPERIVVDCDTPTPSRIEVVERDGQRTVIKLARTDLC